MKQNGRVQGKVAVVSGAAQGIGAVFAQALAREGASVVVVDVSDTAPCVQAITDAGGKALGIKADITSNADLEALVKQAEAAFGPIQILVNNASLFAKLELKPFFQMTEEEWDRVMTVNARGTFQACKAVLPSMMKAGGGKIVNIASGTVYYGPPGMAHYTASKGAVVALTRSISRELGDKNIQVNAINPGLTESEGLKGNHQFDVARGPTVASRAIKREMTPEDMVGTLLYLCSQDSDFVTGQCLNVDGGKINT
ncbi:dehydrogenase [Hydrogenophaga crassostreae]|uniref:Dehydrogenase n=1 Tax=Hydrogenophaga crassostreae TaxID=1763535 RepID=A0A162N1J6_9BURK|nr:glucose 1-dehydrogenase [Hydrogenophaga crassostreae]AOW13800.1 dehydrogenase [Hydrogenophaga crassostreae]OAD44235.1 dehydrogenase [Hydrogenophaga crassostreae]